MIHTHEVRRADETAIFSYIETRAQQAAHLFLIARGFLRTMDADAERAGYGVEDTLDDNHSRVFRAEDKTIDEPFPVQEVAFPDGSRLFIRWSSELAVEQRKWLVATNSLDAAAEGGDEIRDILMASERQALIRDWVVTDAEDRLDGFYGFTAQEPVEWI